MIKLRWATRLLTALLGRPRLWATAVSAVSTYAPNGWYRKFPFLPIPTAEFLEFRSYTAYGKSAGSESMPDSDDFILYLEWFRKYRDT